MIEKHPERKGRPSDMTQNYHNIISASPIANMRDIFASAIRRDWSIKDVQTRFNSDKSLFDFIDHFQEGYSFTVTFSSKAESECGGGLLIKHVYTILGTQKVLIAGKEELIIRIFFI